MHAPVMKDILLSDFALNNLRGIPFSISQCTTFSGAAGACNTSLFEIEDLTFENVAGTIGTNPIASLRKFYPLRIEPCKKHSTDNLQNAAPLHLVRTLLFKTLTLH